MHKIEYNVYTRNAIGKTNFIADGLFAGICLCMWQKDAKGREAEGGGGSAGRNNAVQRSQSVLANEHFYLIRSNVFICFYIFTTKLTAFKIVKLIVKYLEV